MITHWYSRMAVQHKTTGKTGAVIAVDFDDETVCVDYVSEWHSEWVAMDDLNPVSTLLQRLYRLAPFPPKVLISGRLIVGLFTDQGGSVMSPAIRLVAGKYPHIRTFTLNLPKIKVVNAYAPRH